jgi:hypothetical protein
VHNPQNTVGNVANYSMQFIVGTNRHQSLSGTFDAMVAADNLVRLVDTFVAAGNAKIPNAARKVRYDRLLENPKNKKGTTIAVCNQLLAPIFAVEKSGVQYQHDYFKKLA